MKYRTTIYLAHGVPKIVIDDDEPPSVWDGLLKSCGERNAKFATFSNGMPVGTDFMVSLQHVVNVTREKIDG